MRTLHVAAMPFPSVQGTQAAVAAMVRAEARAGRGPELLTYAHGASAHGASAHGASAAPHLAGAVHHRTADLVRDRSLRSGPSLRKLVQDVQVALAVRRLAGRADALVAHHVEACAACLLSGASKPLLFFAHTALAPELPTYLPAELPGPWPTALRRGLARALSASGAALDRALLRRADGAAALSPDLRAALEAQGDRPVTYVPVPWPVPAPIAPEERAAARRELGLGEEPLLLYAGNLDAYQGLGTLLEGFARLRAIRKEARLLVATASDPRALDEPLRRAGLGAAVTVTRLGGAEADRRRIHAAADLAVVPRRSPGGLPIKLLDALARGLPVVATRRATAGLALEDVAALAADDDPEALARAMLAGLARAPALREAATPYVRATHGDEAFRSALDAALREARRRWSLGRRPPDRRPRRGGSACADDGAPPG
ncbi:MAG: glycosyltransferase [Sandaracinaceae bacterium]